MGSVTQSRHAFSGGAPLLTLSLRSSAGADNKAKPVWPPQRDFGKPPHAAAPSPIGASLDPPSLSGRMSLRPLRIVLFPAWLSKVQKLIVDTVQGLTRESAVTSMAAAVETVTMRRVLCLLGRHLPAMGAVSVRVASASHGCCVC